MILAGNFSNDDNVSRRLGNVPLDDDSLLLLLLLFVEVTMSTQPKPVNKSIKAVVVSIE